jgi:ATP-binding cassette subfamily B protein
MSAFRRRLRPLRQHDVSDCGAACLAALADYHGVRIPIARIRQLASTERDGTSALGLVTAATRLAFDATAVRCAPESLPLVPLPAIAHVRVERGGHHFVVLVRHESRRVHVMDPAEGKLVRWPAAEFKRRWTGVLLLVAPGASLMPRDERPSLFRRLWSLLAPHRVVTARMLAGAIAWTILALVPAIYVQKIVDHVLADASVGLLNVMTVAVLLLLAAQIQLGVTRDLLLLRTGQHLDGALILGYYRHLLRLPQRFFDTMRVGEVISRVNDAVKIRAFINEAALDVVMNVLIVAFASAFLALYSWQLAAIVLASVPLYAAVLGLANRANRRTQRSTMERAADLEAQLVESLNAIGTVRRFGLERHVSEDMESRFVRLLRAIHRSGRNAILIANASQGLSRLCAIAVLWIGARAVLAQELSAGELMSCYAIVGYLTGPLAALVNVNRTVQDALIAADRLFEIMDLELEARADGVELTPSHVGDLHLERVTFRYGARPAVFDDLTLTIRAGALTGVVGQSGSGKSTLFALLQRLYPLERGRVRLGRVDLAHASTESLRRLIGVVPQEVQLLSGTVLGNIALGDESPDLERVLAVCDLLGLTAELDRIPGGLEATLGEHGVSLSGGQRQRIALARALYRDPQILLLDEPTSALDAVAERHVHRALDWLRGRGRTVLVVAHRLSTVRRADRLVVLERGRVVEEGTHDELVRARGHYWRLWRWQHAEPDDAPAVDAA